MLSLPDQLEAAIEAALQDVPASKWKSTARAVSERYRALRTGEEQSLARGSSDVLGYAAIIFPAAYAQLSGAMAAVQERVPDWQPKSLLDIGSGPGTALWAACEQWPSLQKITAWEREPAFIQLGRQLVQQSTHPALRQTNWQRATIGSKLPALTEKYDLIVFGHVLNELPPALRKEIVTLAWQQCSGILLIVEPGTSAAFPIVKTLREYLLTLDARTIAPCAHDQACPLLNDWCHFPQRLARPAFQRRAKEGTASWEESKFSYAAMARFKAEAPIWGRLIHQPHKTKRDATLTVSSSSGIVNVQILKSHREAFKQSTDYKWGEALNHPIEEPE